MSADLAINLSGLMPVQRMLGRLARLPIDDLLEVIGSEVESQTRRRISDEKTDPDGKPWPAWSPGYAEHRASGGGLLELRGDLRDSLTYEVGDDAVTVGSTLVYGAVHNEGDPDRNIPERRYLGLSDENVHDISALVVEFFARRARS